jgi:hypothetical protein
MAIGNYGKALGQMARESVSGAVKGFGMGIKGAAMQEMPAVSALYGFSREIKGRADKLSNTSGAALNNKISAKAAVESVQEQKTNNIISLEMVRQLKSINNSMGIQAKILSQQQQADRQRMQFAEESERESNQRNKQLVDAIKGLGGRGGAGGVGGGSPAANDDSSGGIGGFLSSLLGANAGEILAAIGAGGAGIYGAKKIFGRGGKGGGGPRKPSKLSRIGTMGKAAAKAGRIGRLARIGAAGARVIGGGLSGPAGWALAGLSAYEIYQLMFGDDGSAGPLGATSGGGLFSSQGGQAGPYGKGAAFDSLSERQKELYLLRKNKVKPVTSSRVTQKPGAAVDSKPTASPSTNLADKIIQVESGGKNIGTNVLDAKGKPTSSAFGIGQMTKGTFETMMARAKPGDKLYDYTNAKTIPPMKKGPKTFEQFKQDVAFQRIALDALLTANTTQLQKAGIQPTDANIYLAHFLGAAGATKVLNSPDNTPLANVIGGEQLKANPDLFGGPGKPAKLKTVADLKRWATAKMGVAEMKVGSANASPDSKPVSVTSSKSSPVSGAPDTGAPSASASAGGAGGGGDDKDAKKIDTYAKGTSLAAAASANIGTVPTAPIPAPTSSSGSPGENKPIQVEDKGANAKLKTIAKGAVLDSKLGIANYKTTQKQTRDEKARRTSRIETPEQKLLRQANERFLKSFQNTTANLLGKELNKAFTVGFYGKEGSRNLVSKQQASGQMFRGQQLSGIFNLKGKSEKLLSGIFGKDIAKAYAPMVAQLGTAYLEVGARFAGRGLFSGAGFSDKDADALTGQILGNFARGNKQAATEQLLYGLTGVASGPESIFFKYGFSSSKQGSNFLGQMGAAAITSPIAGMMGGPQPTYRDPRTGQMYSSGQYPGSTTLNMPSAPMGANGQTGAYYSGMNALGKDTRYVNPEVMNLAVQADKAARDALPHISEAQWKSLDQAKAATKEAEKQYLESEAGTSAYRASQEAREQAQYRETQITNDILRTQPKSVGGGSSAGGAFMSNMGNFAFDLGSSMVANKLTQGIKNPYLKAFANYALVSGANTFVKPMLASALGFGAPGAAGAAGVGAAGAVGTLGSIGSAFMDTTPGYGVAAATGTALHTAGYTTAGNFMTGVQSGMNVAYGSQAGTVASQIGMEGTSFAIGETVGQVLPYTGAIIKALQGDIVGAIGSAAGTYIGSAIGNFFLPGIGGIIGGAIGSFIGGFLGGGPSSPAYKSIQRVVRVGGNNDPSQRVTTASGNGPPVEFTQFTDSLLTGAFNAVKFIEKSSGVTFPYDYVGVYVHQKHGVRLRVFKAGADLGGGGNKELDLGGVQNFNASKAMVAIADFIKTCMSESKDAATLKKLDIATKLVKTKGAKALTTDILRELSPGGKYALDQSANAGIYHQSATMSKQIEEYYNGIQAHMPTGGGGQPRMVWSFKDNAYVEAPSTMKDVTVENDWGMSTTQSVKMYDDTVIGIDKNGNAIYNYESGVKSALTQTTGEWGQIETQGAVTVSDLQSHATNVYPNYVEPVTSGSGTVTAVTPSYDNYQKGKVLDKAAVAVVGSNNTNTTNDNSTTVTNVNQVSATTDPWKTNTLNTGMALVG